MEGTIISTNPNDYEESARVCGVFYRHYVTKAALGSKWWRRRVRAARGEMAFGGVHVPLRGKSVFYVQAHVKAAKRRARIYEKP